MSAMHLLGDTAVECKCCAADTLRGLQGSFLAAGQLPVGPEGKPIRLAVNEEGRIRSIRPVVESKENKQN
jgi:hypothetical protein